MSYTTNTAIEQPKPAPRFAPATDQAHNLRPRRSPSSDDVLQHYLKRIDPEIAASFTEPQRDAIKSILGARGMTKHAVEIRHSLPFAKWRLYIVLLMGKEQRSLHRLRSEGAASRPFNLLVYICLAGLLGATALGVILALGL